jgi:hypothetical protein
MNNEDSQSEVTSGIPEDGASLFSYDTEAATIDTKTWKTDRNCVICNVRFSKNISHGS